MRRQPDRLAGQSGGICVMTAPHRTATPGNRAVPTLSSGTRILRRW